MPKLNLTQKEIKKIVPPESGRVDYFDTELKGFLLRVSADYIDKKGEPHKGAKVFYVQVGVIDASTGKFVTRKAKIGHYGEYTPEQARQKAPEIIRRIREGKPADEKPPTLQMMYDRYLADKRLTKGTEAQYKGYVPRLFDSWLSLPLNLLEKTLTPEIVIDKFQHIHGNNGPSAANNSFKCLQAIINYAELLYPQFIFKNPILILSRAEVWAKIEPREECLEPNQFKIFADALLTSTPAHRDCYMLALYHGIRPQEAYSLKWEHVDFVKERITLVHETQTSKRTYIVPMSLHSKSILTRRKEAAYDEQVYVFPSQGPRNKHEHLMLRADDLKKRTGLDITVHALRSSFITTGERLRLRRQDINMLTGHADNTVTGRHYVRLTPEDLKPVLQAIADEIERLMMGRVG